MEGNLRELIKFNLSKNCLLFPSFDTTIELLAVVSTGSI